MGLSVGLARRCGALQRFVFVASKLAAALGAVRVLPRSRPGIVAALPAFEAPIFSVGLVAAADAVVVVWVSGWLGLVAAAAAGVVV